MKRKDVYLMRNERYLDMYVKGNMLKDFHGFLCLLHPSIPPAGGVSPLNSYTERLKKTKRKGSMVSVARGGRGG